MKHQENPPQLQDDLTIEQLADSRELDPRKTAEVKIQEIFEQANKIHPGKELRDEEKKQIEELKKELSVETLIKTAIDNAPTGEEVYKDERPAEEKQQQAKHVSGIKKALLTGTMFLAGMFAAKASEKNPSDSLKDKEVPPIELSKSTATKVNAIPKDYTLAKKDNITFGYKVTDGASSKLEMAKPSLEKGGEAYQSKLIEMLGSGISPEELAAKKYISASNVEEYRKYYKAPEVDVVYIEPEKPALTQETKEVHTPAFAKMPERYFGPNQHAVADIYFGIRESKDETDGGMINSSYVPIKIQFLNDKVGHEGELLGNPIIISGEEVQNYLVATTTTFKSPEALKELKERAGIKD